MDKLTDREIIKYVRWVYHECDTPISEIEWLVDLCLSDQDSHITITENIKAITKQI